MERERDPPPPSCGPARDFRLKMSDAENSIAAFLILAVFGIWKDEIINISVNVEMTL